MSAGFSDFVYETAQHKLTRQESRLESVRQRAGVVLSATTIAASVLGASIVADESEVGPLFWAGAAAFAFAVVATLAVLFPRKGWLFSPNVKTVLEDYEVGEYDDLSKARIQLARFMHGWIVENERMLKKLHRWLAFEVLSVGVLVATWMFELGG